MVLIGGVAGGKAEVDLYQILLKRLHVIGTVLRARSLEEKIAITNTFADGVVPLLMIDSEDAHRCLESNETFGNAATTGSPLLQKISTRSVTEVSRRKVVGVVSAQS
jgi:hypothetical protein